MGYKLSTNLQRRTAKFDDDRRILYEDGEGATNEVPLLKNVVKLLPIPGDYIRGSYT